MQVLLEKYLAEFAAVIIYMYIPFFFFLEVKVISVLSYFFNSGFFTVP